ncbi:MAG: mannose-1-phosphate guanylyltransferase/mannose-6-phosphate isomerase [Burkholderiales bacterium]|nr:mannose-1-phosphate guanylyltransferase/mannose-6-phosphate isomerase [Burkholderiales bacterium]
MTIPTVVPLILSGGAGTRLWPLSRDAAPKPLMHLPQGGTLIGRTAARALAVPGAGPLVTVTRDEHYFATRDAFADLPAHARERAVFLLEPFGRNTAPAIALSALWASRHVGDDVPLIVLPADHLIHDVAAFVAAVERARLWAARGRLVTFGVAPTRPETGYGYLECGAPLDAEHPGVVAVERFVEKPPRATAERYAVSGRHLWNSGMFCFTPRSILAAFAAHAPDIERAARATFALLPPDARQGRIAFDPTAFDAMPERSIDYAVMEKADGVVAVRGAFDWSDIGSWQAVGELVAADAEGNRRQGTSVAIGTRDTMVHAEDRVVATVGVRDLVIVDTADATLVAHRDHLQDVKEVVAALKALGHEAWRNHRTVARPWGAYTVLLDAPQFKIKRIEVSPGHALSLQRHRHRSEHWVVVQGRASVTRGDERFEVGTNESTFVPASTMHRLENEGESPLVVIEVQCGDYLGEDDIERFDDRYGR